MPVSNFSRVLRHLQAWRPFPRGVLVYVDVRHMRSVNRMAAPGAADAVIREVAAEMSAWAGEHGLAERLWSNEFIAGKVIDHGQAAIEEASALRDRLASIRYASLLGDNHIAVSIGLVVVGPHEAWNEALGNAAEACEMAKRRGLNQIVSFSRPHAEIAQHVNAAYVLNFRRLVADERLALHPQPIMDISGAQPRLAKAEFLLRAEHDGRHAPLPAATIETLEYFGLASELDAFCAQHVLAWLTDSPASLQRLDNVSMNLSAKSIVDGQFMDGLLRDVRSLRLPAGKLCFEITETAAVEHLDVAAEVIEAFQAIGCRFSLDDFGSGLCSFGYLQRLGVDEVKIDGRFVRDIVQNPVSHEIVRAIHQVARATGKKTVAEFVDDARKLAVLKGLGIDYAQGWLFHPAMPLSGFMQLLDAAPPAPSASLRVEGPRF